MIVSAPPRITATVITRFVAQHHDWIERQLAKLRARPPAIPPHQVMVFGQLYHQVIHPATDRPPERHPVVIHGQELHIYPVQTSRSSANRAIDTFLKTTAQKYLIPRTEQLAKMMGTTYTGVTLRQQRTRWGSCSSQGRLNFNWRLVQYPTAIIDYVIIHELAHRTEMNHSARFWAIVAKYDPAYQSHRRWLQKYGSTVD